MISATVRDHPVIIFLGTLMTGFLAGAGAYQAVINIAKLEVVSHGTSVRCRELKAELTTCEAAKSQALMTRHHFLGPDSSTNRGSLGEVRIVAATPDPVGADDHFETVSIKNSGRAAVVLRGWKVRDSTSSTWKLDKLAMLAPGETKTIQREGQRMSLTNTGDRIELLNERGAIVHRVTYDAVVEGQAIRFPE